MNNPNDICVNAEKLLPAEANVIKAGGTSRNRNKI